MARDGAVVARKGVLTSQLGDCGATGHLGEHDPAVKIVRGRADDPWSQHVHNQRQLVGSLWRVFADGRAGYDQGLPQRSVPNLVVEHH